MSTVVVGVAGGGAGVTASGCDNRPVGFCFVFFFCEERKEG